MKKCTKCKKEKESNLKNFYKDSRAKDGLSSSCKECGGNIRKKYFQENHSKILILKKQYRKTPKSKYSRYKTSARVRKYYFELTLEEFSKLIYQRCYYCGSEEFIGIDRKDNKKGYTVENSVSCCKECNFSKHTQNASEFIERCKKIASVWK